MTNYLTANHEEKIEELTREILNALDITNQATFNLKHDQLEHVVQRKMEAYVCTFHAALHSLEQTLRNELIKTYETLPRN